MPEKFERADIQVRRVLRAARQSPLTLEQKKEILAAFRKQIKTDQQLRDAIENESFGAKAPGIYVFEHNEMKAAVKWCGQRYSRAIDHGFDTRNYAEFYRKYRRAKARGEITPKHYALVRVRPFGIARSKGVNYLLMEHLTHEKKEFVLHGFKAKTELKRHAEQITAERQVRIPQMSHLLTLGSIETPEGKKWVLALPHDYF